MLGQLIVNGIPAAASYIGNKFGPFLKDAASAYARSGMTTPYGKVPTNYQMYSGPSTLGGLSAPRKTLDDFDFGPFSYGPNETRHPGFTGYDITQMMIGQDPEFMSRIYYGQQADRLAGGGVENTLAAMQYLKERNEAREAERFAKYGNPAPGSKFANPNLGNQEPTYATRQDYDQPQITDIDIFGTLL